MTIKHLEEKIVMVDKIIKSFVDYKQMADEQFQSFVNDLEDVRMHLRHELEDKEEMDADSIAFKAQIEGNKEGILNAAIGR